jgi:DNA-binding NtrC family response regulator
MEMIENTLIIQALERTGNNKNQAAKLLGLNRTTLVERLKKRRLAFKDDDQTPRK